MAVNNFYTNLDLQGNNQLLRARLQNATGTEMVDMIPSMTSANIGMAVWNTTSETPYFWTGTAWWTPGGASPTATRGYFDDSLDTVADTPLTVTHSLGLTNKDAFIAQVKDSTGKVVFVEINSVDVNSLTITTSISLTGLKIFVTGM